MTTWGRGRDGWVRRGGGGDEEGWGGGWRRGAGDLTLRGSIQWRMIHVWAFSGCNNKNNSIIQRLYVVSEVTDESDHHPPAPG